MCEAHNGNWFAASNVICMIGNDQQRPDAGAWFQWPSYDELHEPIKNCCIPPDLWFEVVIKFCLKTKKEKHANLY